MVVHHINRNRADNRIENLEIISRGDLRKLDAGWIFSQDEWMKPCSECGEHKRTIEFYRIQRKNGTFGFSPWCKPCNSAARLSRNRRDIAKSGDGSITEHGYRKVFSRKAGKAVPEHRLVWEITHGPIPDGMCIHHLNEDKADNRIENLCLITFAEHQRRHAGWKVVDGTWFKPCPYCSEFFAYNERSRCNTCLPCKRKYQAEWRARKRSSARKE
jgi:hypothetical protein